MTQTWVENSKGTEKENGEIDVKTIAGENVGDQQHHTTVYLLYKKSSCPAFNLDVHEILINRIINSFFYNDELYYKTAVLHKFIYYVCYHYTINLLYYVISIYKII